MQRNGLCARGQTNPRCRTLIFARVRRFLHMFTVVFEEGNIMIMRYFVQKILLKSIISCLDKIDDPISITKYAFNSTTIPVTFPLVAMLKVKIVPELPKDNYGFSLEIKMPRAFGRQYNEVS